MSLGGVLLIGMGILIIYIIVIARRQIKELGIESKK